MTPRRMSRFPRYRPFAVVAASAIAGLVFAGTLDWQGIGFSSSLAKDTRQAQSVPAVEDRAQEGLRRETLAIVSASGRHRFEVEVAETGAARARGLMFRRELAADAGMLFDFRQDREVAFWMRNTLIPLDLLFIEKTGRIAHIARNAVPLSEELIPSRAVVRFVLEVPGGRAAELGVDVGDVVQGPTIAAAMGSD